MEEFVFLKCPFCGGVLKIINKPGLENKNINCPACHHKNHFSHYRQVKMKPVDNDPDTVYPGHNTADKEETEIGGVTASSLNLSIGSLIVGPNSYQLKPGRNVIGRKASNSKASIQLETGENRRMSREHLIIEVKKEMGKGFVHIASLAKDNVNDTFIGGEKLYPGDSFILAPGVTINLPDFDIKFNIEDSESTVY